MTSLEEEDAEWDKFFLDNKEYFEGLAKNALSYHEKMKGYKGWRRYFRYTSWKNPRLFSIKTSRREFNFIYIYRYLFGGPPWIHHQHGDC